MRVTILNCPTMMRRSNRNLPLPRMRPPRPKRLRPMSRNLSSRKSKRKRRLPETKITTSSGISWNHGTGTSLPRKNRLHDSKAILGRLVLGKISRANLVAVDAKSHVGKNDHAVKSDVPSLPNDHDGAKRNPFAKKPLRKARKLDQLVDIEMTVVTEKKSVASDPLSRNDRRVLGVRNHRSVLNDIPNEQSVHVPVHPFRKASLTNSVPESRKSSKHHEPNKPRPVAAKSRSIRREGRHRLDVPSRLTSLRVICSLMIWKKI